MLAPQPKTAERKSRIAPPPLKHHNTPLISDPPAWGWVGDISGWSCFQEGFFPNLPTTTLFSATYYTTNDIQEHPRNFSEASNYTAAAVLLLATTAATVLLLPMIRTKYIVVPAVSSSSIVVSATYATWY